VWLNGTPYPTLLAAYQAAGEGAEITAHAEEFTGNLTLDREVMVTLKGGRDCGHTKVADWTSVKGTVTVGKGAVIVENVIIR